MTPSSTEENYPVREWRSKLSFRTLQLQTTSDFDARVTVYQPDKFKVTWPRIMMQLVVYVI